MQDPVQADRLRSDPDAAQSDESVGTGPVPGVPGVPGQGAGRPIVRIHLLGSMRATTFVGDDVLPRGRKARAVLGCLCLAAGARVPRSRLAAMLWDRVSDFQARASFRQAFRELIVA